MASHFDISHAISMHPLPLANISHSSDREQSTTPRKDGERGRGHLKGGTSSSFEAYDANTEQYENVNHRSPQSSSTPDLENQPGATTLRNDPYGLSTKLKTTNEMDSIRTSIQSKSRPNIPFVLRKDAFKARRVHNFYKEQNENIERLLKPVDEHRREAKEETDSNALQYKIAVNASFAANLCLAVLQIYGAASSGSLSLLTTMADAIFDPCSNLTLILCNRAVTKVNPRKFPQGKMRIETSGNITFCFLMTAVSFILIVESIRELVGGHNGLTTQLHIPSVAAIGTAFVVKMLPFLYCYSLRNMYSQIHILWEDHRNDLFINGVGLLTSVLGSKVRWWIDPAGAIILSVLIASLWLRTAWSEFQLLIGVSAEPSMLQFITYISMTHSDAIRAIDTVRAWHSGPRLIVEVDIVMNAEDTLRATHDVAEELQTKLESLPNVDRAYVHVDYETSHAPEHFMKKEL